MIYRQRLKCNSSLYMHYGGKGCWRCGWSLLVIKAAYIEKSTACANGTGRGVEPGKKLFPCVLVAGVAIIMKKALNTHIHHTSSARTRRPIFSASQTARPKTHIVLLFVLRDFIRNPSGVFRQPKNHYFTVICNKFFMILPLCHSHGMHNIHPDTRTRTHGTS